MWSCYSAYIKCSQLIKSAVDNVTRDARDHRVICKSFRMHVLRKRYSSMASSGVVGGCKKFSVIIRQHMLNTVSSQGCGCLCWLSCLQASTAARDTCFRWSCPPNRWGMVYMRIGRPLGATAFLLFRTIWVFHRCTTCCSSSYVGRKDKERYCELHCYLQAQDFWQLQYKSYWMLYCAANCNCHSEKKCGTITMCLNQHT